MTLAIGKHRIDFEDGTGFKRLKTAKAKEQTLLRTKDSPGLCTHSYLNQNSENYGNSASNASLRHILTPICAPNIFLNNNFECLDENFQSIGTNEVPTHVLSEKYFSTDASSIQNQIDLQDLGFFKRLKPYCNISNNTDFLNSCGIDHTPPSTVFIHNNSAPAISQSPQHLLIPSYQPITSLLSSTSSHRSEPVYGHLPNSRSSSRITNASNSNPQSGSLNSMQTQNDSDVLRPGPNWTHAQSSHQYPSEQDIERLRANGWDPSSISTSQDIASTCPTDSALHPNSLGNLDGSLSFSSKNRHSVNEGSSFSEALRMDLERKQFLSRSFLTAEYQRCRKAELKLLSEEDSWRINVPYAQVEDIIVERDVEMVFE